MSEDKLNRIEAILGVVAQQQQTNTEAINQLTGRFDSLVTEVQRVLLRQADRLERTEASVEFLVDAVTRLTRKADADSDRWREMQADIRGLQTENRQILEYLFGRRNGNGGGNE